MRRVKKVFSCFLCFLLILILTQLIPTVYALGEVVDDPIEGVMLYENEGDEKFDICEIGEFSEDVVAADDENPMEPEELADNEEFDEGKEISNGQAEVPDEPKDLEKELDEGDVTVTPDADKVLGKPESDEESSDDSDISVEQEASGAGKELNNGDAEMLGADEEETDHNEESRALDEDEELDNGEVYKKNESFSEVLGGNEELVEALATLNDSLTAEKYVYARVYAEESGAILGIEVGAGSYYADLKEDKPDRKTAVFYDLYHNKPTGGYDLVTLQTYFADIVATRLVTQESVEKVNSASTVADLDGVSWVTMLLEGFQTVKNKNSYSTHSGIPIEEKISTLQNLVERYNALYQGAQTAVLQTVFDGKPYTISNDTINTLAAALLENTEPDKTDHINWYLKKGENASEYQISNAKELLGLAELVNGTARDAEDKPIKAVDFFGKCIILTNDIDLSKTCHPAVSGTETDPGTEEVNWRPIGTSRTSFKGTFDGGNCTISSIYINSNETHLGLFGYIDNATIKNLTVEGSIVYTGTSYSSYVAGIAAYVAGNSELEGLTNNVDLINNKNYTGGIAAYMAGASKISRCTNHGDIDSSGGYVGGILGRGYNSNALISNCYVTADINGDYYTGAIVGDFNNSATIRDCFYYNPNKGMTIAGRGKPINCYYLSDTPIESANGIAKSEDSFKYGEVTYLLNSRSAHSNYWVQGEVHPVFGDIDTEPLYCISITPHVAESDIEFEFVDPDNSLHPISNEAGGKSLYVPDGTKISIRFKDDTYSFFSVPEDACIPDEKEKGVYHITVSCEDVVVTYGTAEELTQPTLSWYSKDEVTYTINMEPELRGLAWLVNGGYPELEDDFKGKTVILGRDIKLNGDWQPIGKGNERPFKGTFDGNGYRISGLKIGSSAKDGAVDGNYQGLFGYTEGTLKDLTVTGSVYGKDDYIGGIVGYSTSTIENCTFGETEGGTSYVSGKNYVGGIVGCLDGYYSGPITSCYNSGSIVGEERVGGIVGYASSTSKDRVKDNINSGHISGNKDVGGIVGYAQGGVSGNKNSGNIQGLTNIDSNIGGIVGFSNRTYAGYLLQNSNTGKITGEGNNIGGIVGYAKGPISGMSNSGDITGNSNVGGIVGNLESKTEVINSYSTGKVTAIGEDGTCGSLVGADNNGSSIKNSYSYNIQIFHVPFSGSEGTTITDSYYLVLDGYEGNDKAAKTAEQFKSGEVAWLLDGGEETRAATAWTQNDAGDYPVLGEKPVFRVKIKEGTPVEGCSLNIGEGGLTAPFPYTETNPENPDETWEWEMAYVRSGEKLHITTNIAGDYEVIFTPPLELKKTDTDYIFEVGGNYTGHYTFGVIVPPDYSWYSNPEAKEYTLNNEAHLVALGELVNGTAVIDGGSIPAVDFVGKVINLGADINLKTGNWKAIGKKDTVEKKDTPFKGTFDGKAYNISGLNINAVSDNQGLFGYIENATINDLSVSGAVYSNGKNTGGIVGFASGTCRFENLSFGSGSTGGEGDSGEEPIKTSIVSGAEATGGILGAGMFSENSTNESMTFINCINHGVVSGSGTETGGIVGYIYHTTNKKNAEFVIQDCKNYGTIEGEGYYTAGIVAKIGSGTSQYIAAKITDTSNNGSVKGQNSYTAGIVGYAVGPSDESAGKSSISGCFNNGTVAGNKAYMGGIAAYMLNYAEITDCSNGDTIESDGGNYIGGIIGSLQSQSDNVTVAQSCYNQGDIRAQGRYIGGISGSSEANTSIKDCYNEGKVIGKDYTGGISGNFIGQKLERCYNLGRVEGTDRIGGIVGNYRGDEPLSICFNNGQIIGTDRVGGIVGKVEKNGKEIVTSCYNNGYIFGTGSSAKAGGITGENSFSEEGGWLPGIPSIIRTESGVSYCYNHGKVLASEGEAGAITAGYYQLNKNCFYSEDSISDPVDSDNAMPIDEDELATGKVAWIMNGGTGKRIDGWSQREGSPVIVGPGNGPTYRISIRASQYGRVAGSSSAQDLYTNAQDPVELSIAPDEGYLLKLLTVDGYNTGKNYLSISNILKVEFDMPSEDVIITPIFGPWGLDSQYTVTFKVDGKTYGKPQVVANGGTATEPDAPVKEGHSFDGWYTAEVGGQRWNFATAITEDVTLYAHWRVAGMAKVTFDANGGHFSDGSEITVIEIESGKEITFPQDPERSDVSEEGDVYTFNGWYGDRLGENKVDETHIVTEDMTCYANWNTVDKFTLGTEEDPFVIDSLEVLRELASRVNKGNEYEDCYFQLAEDAEWVLTDWTPIGAIGVFKGNFDGNGVTIELKGSGGLFGTLTKVKIQNFTLVADIEGGENIGAVASTVICNTMVSGEHSEFKDITVKGKVSGSNDVGGFVGHINLNHWGSGGYDTIASFENCHNKATVTGTGNRVGGFVGTHYSHSIYRECSNSGKVTGVSGVGGLDGYAMYVTIEDTHNTGEIMGSGDNVGGLIGAMGVGVYGYSGMNAIFSKSYNTGVVSGNGLVGGLLGGNGTVGYPNAAGSETGYLMHFTQCYNTGNITGKNDYIAGIAGDMNPNNNAILEDCYNIGEIKGDKHVAGIFGYSRSADSIVKDSYNRGDISGSEYVAGIYGSISEGSSSNETTATYCYSSGKITGTGGAIAGGNFEKNSNCYYIEGNITDPVDAEYAIAKTTEDFSLGEVAYLLDGGGGERRDKWTQDKEAHRPVLGTPPYYRIELEGNEGGTVDIDGYSKAFSPSGEVITVNITLDEYPQEEGEAQYEYILNSLTVEFSDGEPMDITDTKSFTMISADAKVTAAFGTKEVAPVEPPEEPEEPEPGIGGGDGKGTGKGKGSKTGDGKDDGGAYGDGEGGGDPTGDGTGEVKPNEPIENDTPVVTPPSDIKVPSKEVDNDITPTVAVQPDVKPEQDDPPEAETESTATSGSPAPDLDGEKPKEPEEPEEEEKEIRVFEIVKKVMHENPILTVIVIVSVVGLLTMGGLQAYRAIKKSR